MKRFLVILAVLFAFTAAFSQDDLKQRSMMKKTIYYATGDGKTGSADYWQMQLGNFDVQVQRKYPGEGVVKIDGSANVAFMSGGYLEGNGYGTRGKFVTEANFAVKRGDKYETIQADSIDFIFYGAEKVKLRSATEPEDLFVFIEDAYNTYPAKNFTLAVYYMDKQFGELKYHNDVQPVAVSFTLDGAKKGYQATLAEANK
jgi:hypothetical protein